jgi:hypothetical protein
MTESRHTEPDPLDVLRGGTRLDLVFADGTTARVFVREVTVEEILEGTYVELLRTDYPAALEHICTFKGGTDSIGPPRNPAAVADGGPTESVPPEALTPGWTKRLSRESWTALREAEARLNFDFAFAELTAAHERGQRLKFVDEQILEQSERLIKTMGSLTSSVNTAGSRRPRPGKPVAAPSAGSGK